jgi:hypothetical protein
MQFSHVANRRTPILKEFRAMFGDARVDDDIARVGRPGAAPDIAPVHPVLVLGWRALDQRRQWAGRRRTGGLRQRERSGALYRPAA